MKDRDSHSTGNGRPPRTPGREALYVITLVSSTAPLPLAMSDLPELAGLAVFRSRLIEDGRERFRLHVGHFSSATAAERLLPAVRRAYPAAFVATAPRDGMGSLDDTAIAQFRVLQAPDGGALDPQARPEARATRRRDDAGSSPSAAAGTGPVPVLHLVAPERQAIAASAASAAPGAPLAREPHDQPVTPPSAHASPVASAGTAAQALQVVPLAPAEAPQKFAVQLVWARETIDLTKIVRLKIFSGYLLYAVETEPGGRREYGVRLGFYGDALSAGLVAQYVRPTFKNAAVVPVSERELARAAAAMIRVAPSRAAGGQSRWPATPVALASVRAH